jgi:methionyl-tRNA synthetase
MSTLYITTPIYYVNDVPHLGHAYTTIAADALARFHRSAHQLPGDATRMLTGTDEHGQKIEEAATKRGMTPRQLTDDVAPRFSQAWRQLNIANDDFIRTTEPRHQKVVAALWKKIEAAGDLYLASYEGWYCVGCEAFYTESQLVKEGDTWQCATHKRPVDWVAKERSWFFRMASYQQKLIDHIEANPDFIRPEGYRNEVVSFLRSGLRDLSVSRTSFSWGISPPSTDPEGRAHVIYVWLDALTNYLSALCDDGNLDSELVKQFWPHAVHLIGKDILRFHAVYWPCFLMSAGLPLPRSIIAHGWWTVRGEKISKSLPATRIDPMVLAAQLAQTAPLGFQIGVDALRYYLLREVPLGNDGDFTLESLFARYNAELANDLGNLINRSITLLQKFGATYPPSRGNGRARGDTQQALQQTLETTIEAVCQEAHQYFSAFAPARALETIWRLVREANRYVDMSAPWALAKKAADGDATSIADLPLVLHTMRAVLIVIADLVSAVMPTTASTLHGWLGVARPATMATGCRSIGRSAIAALGCEYVTTVSALR